MILKYVWRNFRRRKVRTVLMLAALIVGVAALVSLNATVETYERFYVATISNEAGDFDVIITRKEIEPDLLISTTDIISRLQNSGSEIKRVVPRIQGTADIEAMNDASSAESADSSANETVFGTAQLVALNRQVDDLGDLELISGTLNLEPGYAIVLQKTADTFNLSVGETVDVSYGLPIPRREGIASPTDVSQRRTKMGLTVSGIAIQRGVTGKSGQDGILVDLGYVQNQFNIPNLAERIVVAFDEGIYNDNDPQAAALRARALTEAMQTLLDESYNYKLPRATILSNTFEGFIFFQALVSIYGILSLSVVGLLIRTMVMTNVREQTRDLALFRILGSPRRHLFNLVAAEVAALGVVGIGLGAISGQLITNTFIVPFIAQQANVPITDIPLVTTNALLLSVATAAVVLTISAYAPAQRAASTKIMYAINPGVAEGLGFDDLAKLRERRVNVRVFWSGLVVLFYPALIFFVFPLAFSFGVLWLQASLIFGSLLLLILGTAMLFFPITLPMQRILVELVGLLNHKIGYFAKRNILRSQSGNTLISLMIVISATLPTFFATTLAIEQANNATEVRLNNGTPLIIRKFGSVAVQDGSTEEITEVQNRFTPQLIQQVQATGLLGPNVSVTYQFQTSVRDSVGLRNVRVRVYGIDGNLGRIIYDEGVEWIAGDVTSFDQLLSDSNGVIISQGLAEYFELGLNDTLQLSGEGLDHVQTVRIVGVLGRFPGFGGYTSKRTFAQDGRTELFLNLTAFRKLTRDPLDGPYDPNFPVVERLMAAPNLRPIIETLPHDAQTEAIRQAATVLRREYSLTENLDVTSTPEDIASDSAAGQQIQVIILVLTTISFILAIFGVFVVTYIAVYTRRSEIAMLKAMGDSNRHLFGMFLSEALVMTLSATLTGIVAGILLGYIFRYSSSFRQETPTVLALDSLVTPYMLILMSVAALISTLIATWGYLRRRAVEILRMV